MTDRREPTPEEIHTAAYAALDQVEAELDNLRAHLAMTASGFTPLPAQLFSAARSASIVSGMTATIAEKLRGLAARQSTTPAGVDLP